MEKKIKLGIIGVGNMGSAHARNIVKEHLCPELELVAVADTNPDRLKLAREIAPEGVTCFDNAIDMLDSGLVEAVIVAVPHYDHPTYVIECLKRGIHVMSEKPAGVYTKQVRAMNEEAAKHPEVKFGMMFNQRTRGLYIKMHELVHSGKYGRLRRANWIITNWYRAQSYYDSGAWRATWSGEGGGVLLNQCPHQLDLLQWICGMPTKVQSHMAFGKWHDIEVEDDVTSYLEFPDGGTGVFVTTTGDAHGSNRFEIQMDGAKLVAEDGKLTVLEYAMKEQDYSRSNKAGFGRLAASKFVYEPADTIEEHCMVLNAWAGAILRGTPMTAEGYEGINGLTLSNAMHMSAFTNQVIELPLDEDAYYEELKKRIATSRRKENVVSVVNDTSASYNKG